MIKIWNTSQVNLLMLVNTLFGDEMIPKEVLIAVKDIVEILDQNYGSDRHPEHDLGGSVYILEKGTINECDDYTNLLAKYKTSVDMSEFTDPINVQDGNIGKSEQKYQWYIQGFVLSSDFTLTIIYKDKI